MKKAVKTHFGIHGVNVIKYMNKYAVKKFLNLKLGKLLYVVLTLGAY